MTSHDREMFLQVSVAVCLPNWLSHKGPVIKYLLEWAGGKNLYQKAGDPTGKKYNFSWPTGHVRSCTFDT